MTLPPPAMRRTTRAPMPRRRGSLTSAMQRPTPSATRARPTAPTRKATATPATQRPSDAAPDRVRGRRRPSVDPRVHGALRGLHQQRGVGECAPRVRTVHTPVVGRRGEAALALSATGYEDRHQQSKRMDLPGRNQAVQGVSRRRKAGRDAPLPEGQNELLGLCHLRLERRRLASRDQLRWTGPRGRWRHHLEHPDERRLQRMPSRSASIASSGSSRSVWGSPARKG